MQKMVICGASGLNNSGDEAILDVLLHQYIDQFDITVISLNYKNTLLYHKNIKCVELKDKKKCLEIIKKADIFLLGGGGLFQDETSVFNVFRWTNILSMAIKYSKRVVVYANSIGPLKYRFSRHIVRNVLNKVTYITVRDKDSKRLLKNIGVITPISVTADPVFSYPMCNNTVLDYELPSRYVVFAVRHWYDMIPFVPAKITNKIHYHSKKYDKYIETMNQIVEYINVKLKLPVVFLPFYTDRDYTVAQDIINHKKLGEDNIIIGDGKRQILPKDFMAIIKHSELLVGMRLHSLIYATNCITPYIAIIYSSKVKGILKDLGTMEYGIEVDKLTLSNFVGKYNNLVANETDILKNMQIFLKNMQHKETFNKKLTLNMEWSNN